MPFEPLRTDEKLEEKQKKGPDMDREMLFGCTSFVLASFVVYGASVWPFLVFADIWRIQILLAASAFGFVPAYVLTALGSRKYGIAAACGALGGAMATCIFLFLRLDQVNLGNTVWDLPKPEYPPSWQWLLPVGHLLATVAIMLACLRKDQLLGERNASSDR